MSSNLLKQCGVSSQPRSISDIIESLRNSFQPTDFKAALNELMAREEGLRREKADIVASLREKSDTFEGELNQLKLEKIQWEEERRRLRRDLDVNEDNLNDVTRELSLVKEKKEKAIKRYDGLYKELEELGEEKHVLIRNLADMTEMVDTLKGNLREKEEKINELTRENECQRDARLEELDEIRRKNECLEEEKQKFDARMEAIKREKEESLKDMVKGNEIEKRQAGARLNAQSEEVENVRRNNVILAEQKAKSDVLVKEKDERIKKLSGYIELLEREKTDIVEAKVRIIQELEKEKKDIDMEKRKLEIEFGKVKEKFMKLEEDVMTCLCLDLGRDKNFANSQFGKILSRIIKALDSEDVGLACHVGLENDGDIQEADSAFNIHVNEPKCGMKSDEQPVDVRRTLVFDCDDATGNKRTTSANPIIIDSDDDNENFERSNSVKNKRQRSGSLSEHQIYDGSYNDSLNPKLKSKKLKHGLCEHVKQELSSAKNDQKLNSQKHTLAANEKAEDKLRREVTGPRSCSFSEDNDRKRAGSKNDCGTPKADLINRRVEDVISSYQQRKQNKSLECEADMICAFDQDSDLCAKAVCALYRQKKSCISPMNGSISFRSKGFQECDFERLTALAKYLIDGNPRGKMMKSVDELQKHDPRGPEDCRRFANQHSKQLIDIYRKGEDPFFSSLSTDLQYK